MLSKIKNLKPTNILQLNKEKKIINDTFNDEREIKSFKHFPSSVREWNNSIYVYNKNFINLIPSATISALKIIKGYFSLFNSLIEKKMRTKRLLNRFRRLSSNKIYLSNGEFKHTNNQVLITLYTFNRQKDNYLLYIKKWYLKNFISNKSLSKIRNKNVSFKKRLVSRLKMINFKALQTLKKANKNKYFLMKILNNISNKKSNSNNYKSLNNYLNNFYKKLVTKSLKKLQVYLYYRQLLYINRSKLNYTYLKHLKTHLENLYNKNVEFNIVNLKRFYLNSHILSESITLKLTKNRRKMMKYLNKLKNKVKIQKKMLVLTKIESASRNLNVKQDLTNKNKLLERSVIHNLKYRHVTGFRLEAKGRLTRRYTASRSVSKLRYKGNLLNQETSYKGISSVLLKGNLRSNVQYTKLVSKTRIGSFGIKGWVSGN